MAQERWRHAARRRQPTRQNCGGEQMSGSVRVGVEANITQL
jgi:hypothetical protein